MRRKAVSRRLGSVAEVRGSLRAHRGRIGGRLDERRSPPPGEASYQVFFDHMDEELATVERGLVTAEDAHVRKLIRIVQLRRQSQESVATVYGKQTSARQILAGLYGGDRDFELAAISGQTPRFSQTLVEQVDQTVKLLRDLEGELPPERVAGVDIDFEAMATDLETGMTGLEVLRADLVQARKEADATRILTNEAIAEFDRVFPWVSQTLEGLFRLAGEHELADRFRTSVRRVTRKRGEDREEEKPGEPSSDGSSTEESASPPAEEAQAEPPPSEAASEAAEKSPPPATT